MRLGSSPMDSARDVDIRPAQPADPDYLARLRKALWPKTSAAEHIAGTLLHLPNQN